MELIKKFWIGFKREMRVEWYFYFCRIMWLAMVITWMVKPVDMVMTSETSKWAFLLTIFCETVLRIGKAHQQKQLGSFLTVNAISDMMSEKYNNYLRDPKLKGNMDLRLEILKVNGEVLSEFGDIEQLDEDFTRRMNARKKLEVKR